MDEDERIRRAKLARKEARETIDKQSATLSDIDEKAIQIFRANVVLAGIIVSGISIAVRTEGPPADFLNPFTKFGAILLFLATIFASVTYTSTNEEIGVNPDDVTERILNERFDYDLVEEGLAEEYSQWIADNYRANAQNALSFTMALLTTAMAICYFFMGAIEIYRDTLPWYANFASFVLFLGIAKFSGLWGQLKRWYRVTDPKKRFHNWLSGWSNRLSRSDRTTEEENTEPGEGNSGTDGEGDSEDESDYERQDETTKTANS